MGTKIESEELPSFRSMGFREKCANSWPYHPLVNLFETHLEMQFSEYKRTKLDIIEPQPQQFRKKWWRQRFRDFANREIKLRSIVRPNHLPPEKEFFRLYPDLLPLWKTQRLKLILLEAKRDRFGRTRNDFDIHLQLQWMSRRKYEYMMRELERREEPAFRKRRRIVCFNKYSNLLLVCKHWKCWKIRIPYILLIPFMWIGLQLYGFCNKDLWDIH